MTKQAVRQQFLTARKALSLVEVENRSQRIADLFLQWLSTADALSSRVTIHVFLPIQRQREVNTWLIIRELWLYHSSSQIVTSVTNFLTHSLTHYPFADDTLLVNNTWGIPEPVVDERQAIASNQIDLVLVPLLGFDQRGHRVGYGGGFYDRFLADCRADCLKVGLSLFDPIDQLTDTEPTDIKLTHCVTPTQIWQFSV